MKTFSKRRIAEAIANRERVFSGTMRTSGLEITASRIRIKKTEVLADICYSYFGDKKAQIYRDQEYVIEDLIKGGWLKSAKKVKT